MEGVVLRIAIGSDHRGVKIKDRLVQNLTAAGFPINDVGTHGDAAVDYPDIAQAVAQQVANGEVDRGILICGTGIGMSITANKFAGVRAASCYDEVMVEISRRHNDVNILCLPGDMIGDRPIDDLIRMWLNTEFDGGRHAVRIQKIGNIEQSTKPAVPVNSASPPSS
ncbi:MAG: ribose 5-phosphate isomerase B [Rubripirellula sp.]